MALKSVTELKQERGWERNSHIEDLLCQKLGRHVFKRERKGKKPL
jgi:stalled ribosome alternative rescue factor ArfA